MTKITDIPAIRFKGFSDTWEQRKLGEIGSVSMCRRIFKEQTSENGEIPFYKIGTFGGEADAFISRELFEEYKAKYQYPKKGDILISASGSIGRTVVFTGKNEYFQDSNIVWLNHDKHLDNSFLKCFYSIVKWAGIEGSTIKRLYNDNILNTAITLPSVEEQQKIGAYFENLDNLITLHQREFAFLCKEKSKKFRYIKNAWEQRKLSEIATMHARIGWQNLRTSEFLDSGDYMLITGTDFIDGAVNFDTCHYVERERYEQDKHIQIRNGSILITKDGTLGKVAYIQGLTMPATLNAGVFNVEIKDENEVDNRYLFQYLKAPFLMDYVDKKATGGTIKHLNQNILVDFPVVLPHKAEQEKIGEYFLAIDHLITLHQCKCQIDGYRFQSPLAITWEQRKFGEVFDCTVPNNTLSRAELSYDEGTVLNVHYGDVLIKYGSVLDVQKDDIPRIPHRCREDFNGALLQDGDVIIADTAEDETTGKACEIGNLQGSAIVSGLHTMVCRPRNRMALGYLGYYLNSNAYHYQLLPLMQGIKVLSLSRSNIQKTSVSYPSAMKEQQLIASYFSQLDHLITLHQRKPVVVNSSSTMNALPNQHLYFQVLE